MTSRFLQPVHGTLNPIKDGFRRPGSKVARTTVCLPPATFVGEIEECQAAKSRRKFEECSRMKRLNRYAQRSLRTALQLLVFVSLTALVPAVAAAQDAALVVKEHVWGFDGRVQPGQFNPLSILLDNQTDEPIDATATLQLFQGMMNASGGRYAQKIFIAPTARRWIQFYPYVADSYSGNSNQWHLVVAGKKIQDFAQPRAAVKLATEKTDQPPQSVILDRAERFSSVPATVKHLPENIFPPYATATVGLHTVFLDHVPDWESPRQQAFLSWLKQGGRLHLLQDSRGEFPRFSGELTEISKPFDRYAVGKGLVVRHAFQRDGITEDLVRRSTAVDVLQSPDEDFEKQLAEEMKAQNYNTSLTTDDIEASTIDDGFFRGMRELTLPEHSWPLIFLLALCYIGLIFPGCFLLSKNKELHFLTTYGAIIGLSVVFSLLFLFIGRRGYGETTTMQTLAIARAEDDRNWSILQWNAFFVTSGDDYSAAAADQQTMFATSDSAEQSGATIVAGNQGQIAMRIPPFSSQTFVSRRRFSASDWGLKLGEVRTTASSLEQLIIEVGADFPVGDDVEYFVLHSRNVYSMTYNSQRKSLEQLGRKRPLAAFCRPIFDNQLMSPARTFQGASQQTSRTEQQKFFDESLPSLAQRSLFDDLVHSPRRFVLPPDRIRLFVYAPMPEEFELQLTAAAKRTGRILFVKDISLQPE